MSSQTLILLGGRPLNKVRAFEAFDLSNFTTDAVEQIEVLPGGGSVLYGSYAIDGVINIIPSPVMGALKRPLPQRLVVLSLIRSRKAHLS